MTSVGVFGLSAFAVAQRRRELGIRLALGATPREVLQMILSEAVQWRRPVPRQGWPPAWPRRR